MEIEIIHHKKARIIAAMLDWDGFISLLREGWQKVMRKYIADFISCSSPKEKDYFWAEKFIIKTLGGNTVDQIYGVIEKAEQNGRKDIPKTHSGKMVFAEKHRKKYREILEKEIRGRRIKMAKKHPEKFINPGIIDFIKELKKRKIKLFVSSGSEQKGKGGIEEEAEILGLTPYFEAVFGYNGPISPYSKENVVRWIINKYKIENPSQILVVGDGPKEMRVGRKFGAITIGLISANVTSEILKKSGADFIVYHPAALIDCLEYIDPGQL